MYIINTTVSKDTIAKLIVSALVGISFLNVLKVQVDEILLEEDEKDGNHADKLFRAEKFERKYEDALFLDDNAFENWVGEHKHLIDIDLSIQP